jgi:hypothetical protein
MRRIREFETVIAELQSSGEQFFPNQIYIRKKESPKYEPIGGIDQMVSSESAVSSLGRPLLFYLSNKVTKRDNGFGGDWEGLYSFDLQNKTRLKIADKESIRFSSPYVGGFVKGLVDVSADATELYLTVGMMPPDTGERFRMVNHQLARMDLATGQMDLISHLKGLFFWESRRIGGPLQTGNSSYPPSSLPPP